jgi:SRSO17 transposase
MTKDPRLTRLHAYLKQLTGCLGHADRDVPMTDYVVGLLMPGERKSMEPIAARLSPQAVSAKHQSIQHFISDSKWEANRLLDAVRDEVLPTFQRLGGIKAWIIDDTGFPKKGRDSVGVSRQYCGVLGKQDNCQVAVSISMANDHASLPVAWRLYLPEVWAKDLTRREKAKVPATVEFRTKWEIALDEFDRLRSLGVPKAPVLADAGYGVVTEFREGLALREYLYAVGIPGEVTFWTNSRLPLPPKPWSGRGRPATSLRPAPGHGPVSALAVAQELPTSVWKNVTWRQGSNKPLRSRFAAVRVRAAHRQHGPDMRPEEWLIIEWPKSEKKPTKYHLSNLSASASLKELVSTIHLRWRIERDYQELKDEIGIDHFEGRSWRGFHHHAALCIAAYGFIAAERARFFPPQNITFIQLPARKTTKPRGSPQK